MELPLFSIIKTWLVFPALLGGKDSIPHIILFSVVVHDETTQINPFIAFFIRFACSGKLQIVFPLPLQ